ncbi:trehalose-6-phosphate synthase [Henriciella sp.]|uniref:alpha,alpha-trehalose-phosphate synthase (UDP-forming) n=1 Tax=Henriciella sp. TaxID=1968823 RepID=UPI0017E6613C|nr:trehalose-6-phosphate synthase [Henriciella sp.]HIG24107.1 trehalose-6-phosphate synthase [Henriciella sp.]
MGRLIAISNRTAADPSARAGGLAVAVWESLTSTGGMWFGWSGNIVKGEPGPPEHITDEGVDFIVTDFTEAEHDGFYLQYANRVIWPVFHYRVDLAHFGDTDFDAYEKVNKRIADMVVSHLEKGDSVWVHDYHFLLMGDYLRKGGWDGPIGFFLHIPFPSPEVFRALPEHEQIARAMCAFDVLGFQSENDRSNFVQFLVRSCDGVDEGDGWISVFGRRIRANAYPIGIEAESFAKLATGQRAKTAATRIGKFLGGRKLVLGVDRMDYSKGLPQRFEAVGKMFDNFPSTRGRVSFTQIAPPSRSKVEEYQDLRVQLDELAGRINGDYGDLDWIPLRYLARSYDRKELAGLYRIASVCLVTPLRDGMNLVAKEFVMAQDPDDPGVLILSQFAGAAEQLSDTLIVNPHDRYHVAETIYRALEMPLEERQERWEKLRRTVVEQDISWWRQKFLDDLDVDTC